MKEWERLSTITTFTLVAEWSLPWQEVDPTDDCKGHNLIRGYVPACVHGRAEPHDIGKTFISFIMMNAGES